MGTVLNLKLDANADVTCTCEQTLKIRIQCIFPLRVNSEGYCTLYVVSCRIVRSEVDRAAGPADSGEAGAGGGVRGRVVHRREPQAARRETYRYLRVRSRGGADR